MGTDPASSSPEPKIEASSPPSPHRKDDDAPPRDVPSFVRLATDRTLGFLSNASNETLGACLVGLSATTYVLLGRLGLVIIGAVGGVVLHATWENGSHNGRDPDARAVEMRRRKEVGIDILQRVLEWRDSNRDKERAGRTSEDELLSPTTGTDAYGAFKPATAAALNVLSEAVVRDYVRWWYTPLLPLENGFPTSCRRVWNNFMLSMSSHLSRKRSTDAFLDFATNSSSIVIVFLNEVSHALSASPSANPADAVQVYLRLKPNSNLANIIDPKHQERKLLMVADDILENFLDVNVYRCTPARVFLREVLAHLVLEQTIVMCSQASWINEWIVYLLEDGEPELMNVIDEGLGKSASPRDVDVPKRSNEPTPDLNNGKSDPKSKPTADHKRRVSRAEEAMDEAMKEAQRLTKLILEEEAKRNKQQSPIPETPTGDQVSDSTGPPTRGIQTPTSSQEGAAGDEHQSVPMSLHGGAAETEELQPKTSATTPPSTFTSFDQIQPSRVPTGLLEPELPFSKQSQVATFSLVNAKISIFDEGATAEKRVLKSKPVDDYLIQVEPASSIFPGWMIPRKYADFETLHEVIRRIAAVSGVEFTAAHTTLPQWKNATAGRLRTNLEAYLTQALKYEPLAESEGMKRFLDKDRGLTRSPNKGGFWPNPAAFENMGKGMLNVLTKAPNQVAGGVVGGVMGGGKAVIGGVTNVLTGVNALGSNANGSSQRAEVEKQPYPTSGSRKGNGTPTLRAPSPAASVSEKRQYPTSGSRKNNSAISLNTSARTSSDSLTRAIPSPGSASNVHSPLERRQSVASSTHESEPYSQKHISRSSMYGDNVIAQRGLSVTSGAPSRSTTPELTNLPPPPEDMPDDYTSPPRASTSRSQATTPAIAHSQMSVDGTSFFDVPTTSSPSSPARSPLLEHGTPSDPFRRPSTAGVKTSSESARRSPLRRTESVKKEKEREKPPPMSEQEAQVTIELFFAVINELYTLSSAWNIRRTLLGAAKTFLLRPGNPQLESIRLLIQDVIDGNTSDAGVAAHIAKLRENTMPTDEERAKWPAPPTPEEQEKTRVRARKLLVERGMPQALTSVMGTAASGEALGKVFDCLQVAELSRGLMFGVFLQAMRAVTQ